MSHHHSTSRKTERLPIFILGALVLLSLLVIISGHTKDRASIGPSIAEYEDSRMLIFRDRIDGLVDVSDAATGELIRTYGESEGGFARTAMRALAYTRRLQGIPPTEPVRLGFASDGRVLLSDPSTESTIVLNAFGDANRGQLEALLIATKGDQR